MRITNTSDERQAVHTTAGVVFIHPGKSRDVELTPEGEKIVSASGFLETGAKQARKRAQNVKAALDEEHEG